MKQKLSKTEAKNQIDEFFKNLKGKTSEDVKKIKKIAMGQKIKLGDKRKLFCKKCLMPFFNSSVSIKKGFMNVKCSKCGFGNRWNLKGEIDFGFHEHYGEGCC